MKKRQRPEPPTPADGYWWFRNFIPLRGGGYHYEWRIARVVDGRVEVYGPVLALAPNDRYLHRAIWGPAIVPPTTEESASALSLVGARNPQKRKTPQTEAPHAERLAGPAPKALVVAEGIVDAFIETVPALTAYYGDHPADREAVVRRIESLIRAAMQ